MKKEKSEAPRAVNYQLIAVLGSNTISLVDITLEYNDENEKGCVNLGKRPTVSNGIQPFN